MSIFSIQYLEGKICSESFFISSSFFIACHFIIVIKGNSSWELTNFMETLKRSFKTRAKLFQQSIFKSSWSFSLRWLKFKRCSYHKVSCIFSSELQCESIWCLLHFTFIFQNENFPLQIKDILMLQVLCLGLICLGPLNVFSSPW